MSLLAYFIDGNVPSLSRSPQCPAVLCRFEYLNEGGANIIFRVTAKNADQAPSRLHRKLLRIRKNLQHTQPAAEQLKLYNEAFRPLFTADNLIEHELIILDGSIVTGLNDLLKKLIRPSHRAQDYLRAEESHGMLITDMSVEDGSTTLLQIKPKWLAQSPNAPAPYARRCRTCALRAQRLAKNTGTATDEQRNCPLMLISTTAEDRIKAARSLTRDAEVARYMAIGAQPLLNTLCENQKALDRLGVLGVHGVDEISNLCCAMTLRDCTLYIRHSDSGIEAKLGDLDMKQPEKLSTWKKTEQTLIEEGWYMNTEMAQYYIQETICLLSRE